MKNFWAIKNKKRVLFLIAYFCFIIFLSNFDKYVIINKLKTIILNYSCKNKCNYITYIVEMLT